MVLSVGSKKYCAQCGVLGKKQSADCWFFFRRGGDAPKVGGYPSGSTFGGRGARVVFLIFSDVKPGQSD